MKLHIDDEPMFEIILLCVWYSLVLAVLLRYLVSLASSRTKLRHCGLRVVSAW